MTGWVTLLKSHSWTSAKSVPVFGKRAVDGYTDHAVGRMPETLEIGLCFALTQEGGWVAGLHVDAYHLAVS